MNAYRVSVNTGFTVHCVWDVLIGNIVNTLNIEIVKYLRFQYGNIIPRDDVSSFIQNKI